MIKYIINRYTSKRDISGNCYSIVNVINCTNNEETWIKTGWGHGDNIRYWIKKGGIPSDQIHEYQTMLPIREYNRLEKSKTGALTEEQFKDQ